MERKLGGDGEEAEERVKKKNEKWDQEKEREGENKGIK